MTTQLITARPSQTLEIRCDAADAMVANLAVHFVFFFERRLDVNVLADSFAHALTSMPLLAGRIAVHRGRMRIRCAGQGVPFTAVSSHRTLREAITSTSEDNAGWLVDPINGVATRCGLGPLCRVRVTHLADDATAIGFAWHHAIGDVRTLMHFMNAWTAIAAGTPFAQPLIVEDRAAHLDAHLPSKGASEPGVRCLGHAELARSALYLAKDARRQRTLGLYFGADEIRRMRCSYATRMWLSSNDVVCAHVCEALMAADPAVDRRTLAIAVNARGQCGLDPMLVGNIITTLNVDVHRAESGRSIAERLRRMVTHFADEHCDLRANQQFLDAASAWQATRCVSTAFNAHRWNPLITNLSGVGLARIEFEGTPLSFHAMVMKLPVPGLGALMEGAGGRGLMFQMSLPPKDFDAMSRPELQERLHRFRQDGDDIPRLHHAMHG
ncbi:acyltransferase [Mycobacterium sp. ACS4331]|uniref:acyltransferase n=1 Tax=Mycobacterium sp. ACS4331 TaxID=1834121 RepID=UPI0007FCCA92|nr:acyltransferase [Mycobacterium sp. ACS4331]OBF21702.1 hypothetical protein A5727_08265 [Mycobacterium sp. ACS4331]